MERRVKVKVTYENEYRFSILIKALKQFNMRAYKEFIFTYLPELRAGNFLGEKIGRGQYKIKLITEPVFGFVYGDVCVYYRVKKGVVILGSIEPADFLDRSRRSLLPVYKGCPIVSDRDRFMVDCFFATKRGGNL